MVIYMHHLNAKVMGKLFYAMKQIKTSYLYSAFHGHLFTKYNAVRSVCDLVQKEKKINFDHFPTKKLVTQAKMGKTCTWYKKVALNLCFPIH